MNQREKKMMVGLGVVAFLGLNLVLYSSYKKTLASLERERITVQKELKSRETILEASVDWNNVREWFEENKPEAVTVEDAQDKLLKEVKEAAERCKLLINPTKPINFLPALQEQGQLYPRARVTLNFTASDNAMFQWITQMNDAKKFRAVTSLKVEPTADKMNVIADAIVEQWISPADIAIEQTAATADKPKEAPSSPQ